MSSKPAVQPAGYIGQLGNDLLLISESERCQHALVIGGTGSGKTQSIILPNLLYDAYYGNHAALWDLKFPDRQELYGAIDFFRAFDRKTYVFAPTHPDSIRMPFLADIRTVEDAILLAEMITSDPRIALSALHHIKIARAILAATILKVNESRGLYATLQEVHDILAQDVEAFKQWLIKDGGEHLVEETLETNYTLDSYRGATAELGAYQKLQMGALPYMRDNDIGGWLMGLYTGTLQIFGYNQNVNRATSYGNQGTVFYPEEFFNPAKPGLLYMGVPQNFLDSESGSAVVRCTKRFLDFKIRDKAVRSEGRLGNHLMVYIDELPSFGYLPRIMQNLAVFRSSRVGLMLGLQNYKQVGAVYGQEAKSIITSTFAHKFFFLHGIDGEDRLEVSKDLGTSTVEEQTVSQNHAPGKPISTTLTRRMVDVPNFAPEVFPTFKHGQVVVGRLRGQPIIAEVPMIKSPRSKLNGLYQRVMRYIKSPNYKPPLIDKPERPAAVEAPPEVSIKGIESKISERNRGAKHRVLRFLARRYWQNIAIVHTVTGTGDNAAVKSITIPENPEHLTPEEFEFLGNQVGVYVISKNKEYIIQDAHIRALGQETINLLCLHKFTKLKEHLRANLLTLEKLDQTIPNIDSPKFVMGLEHTLIVHKTVATTFGLPEKHYNVFKDDLIELPIPSPFHEKNL